MCIRDSLIPKQLKKHGLNSRLCRMQDAAIHLMIDGYTREAGVRTLERIIASICRKCAKRIASGEVKVVSVSKAVAAELLGPQKFKTEDVRHKDAVSYTHLDVYKRQGLGQLCGEAGRKLEKARRPRRHRGCLLYTSRVFPLHSPNVEGVDVIRHGRVRRSKLYYLRDRVGKAAKVKERLG